MLHSLSKYLEWTSPHVMIALCKCYAAFNSTNWQIDFRTSYLVGSNNGLRLLVR